MGSGGRQTIAVLVGGEPIDRCVADRLGAVDYVIAADSGLHAAERLGLSVDLLVGDLDSVDPTLLEQPGLQVDRHPRAKDQTDIVLALDRAYDLEPGETVVVSGGGGRLDHALANLLVLASPSYAPMRIRALVGGAEVDVVRHRHTMHAPAGTVVSLFAVDGPASGVTTDGLRYPLRDEVLEPLSSRGVSNEFVGGAATISVAGGTLLVIRPGGAPRDSISEDGAQQQAPVDGHTPTAPGKGDHTS